MLKLGVIRKVDQPTEWCHPIVIVTKPNGDIRLCIDLTKLNMGVERELYQLEAVEETLAKLGEDCVYMSKIDANSGYWQVPLDESSQELTTFITPIGRFCCTRGPYGLSSMQEIFGKKMDVVIEGIEGVVKSTDDFLVHAKTIETLRERTRKLFERFAEYGVTINLKKCLFEQTEMEFLGNKITSDGILPLESKMESVRDFPQPENIKQLRRFMGMANHMAKFHPDLSEASAPLRSLMSTKNEWLWTENHTESFNKVKDVIMSPITLKLYDVNRPTKIRVDGSKLNGISVILYQQHDEQWHPVTCGSRYLTPAEKGWYPIEIEMLAVMWGCKRMNMFLHGLPSFKVETDHKPLVPILNTKQIAELSPRIQEMRMKLLKYTFTAHHIPGSKMEDADALSRAPHSQPTSEDQLIDEEISCHLNAVVHRMPVSNSYMKKLQVETKADEVIKAVIKTMSEGWPTSKQLCRDLVQPYWDSRHDLTTHHGLLIKGDRIVVPKSLQKDVLQRLHNAHQGMDRMKRRARQTAYWPQMNSQIENLVNRCNTCLKHKPSKSKDPLQPHAIPTRPWEKVGSDLFQTHGLHYIIITDYYSSYPEVFQLKKTGSQQVVDVMKDTFSRHGIPSELVSDNGSQYKSKTFKQFSKQWEFTHTTSSPRYSRSNGLAESAVKTVKTMIKKCIATNTDVKKGLLAIRNTPLSCGASPAELLMNRQLNDNLPRLPANLTTNKPKRRDLMAEREVQKHHHDKKLPTTKPPTSKFLPGQRVAVQHHQSKEWSIRGQIVEKVGPRSYTVRTAHDTLLRRNQIQIRKLHSTTSWNDTTTTQQQLFHDLDDSTHNTSSSDYDSDDSEISTLPYDEDDETYMLDHDQQQQTSSRGRVIQLKHPTDYEDL